MNATGHLLFICSIVAGVGALKVLHLADFHLDVDYSIDGDNEKMCHKQTTQRRSRLGPFGDYMCDAPEVLVAYAVDEAKRIIPDPDLVIWTGDNIPHVDGYDFDYVVNAMNITTTLLRSRFPDRIVLPTFGNHDYAPANAFETNSTLYEFMWDLWKGLIEETEKSRFLAGGYYKYRLPNATVLVLNTNFYYKSNKAYDNFRDKSDPAGQFAFMQSELMAADECRTNATSDCISTVHIIGHIAPGVFERTPNFTWFRDQYNEKFLQLTVDYSSVIGMMLFGHHHTDTFHLIKNSSGDTVQFALISPAVTPWFSSLKGAGANNPAFRVYDVDMSAGNVVFNDIVTYYVDLELLNKRKSTQFSVEYSFQDVYNISGGIDKKAMTDLVERMKKDERLFQKYINYNSVLWMPQMPQGVYRGGQLCSLEFAHYPRYYECLAQYNSVPTYYIYNAFSIMIIVAACYL